MTEYIEKSKLIEAIEEAFPNKNPASYTFRHAFEEIANSIVTTDLQLTYNEQMVELKEAKMLLRLAIEDFKKSLGAAYTCPYCKNERRKRETCADRETQYCEGICEWRYADEAEKLLNR